MSHAWAWDFYQMRRHDLQHVFVQQSNSFLHQPTVEEITEGKTPKEVRPVSGLNQVLSPAYTIHMPHSWPLVSLQLSSLLAAEMGPARRLRLIFLKLSVCCQLGKCKEPCNSNTSLCLVSRHQLCFKSWLQLRKETSFCYLHSPPHIKSFCTPGK